MDGDRDLPSFRQIDYRIRLNKSAERRMFIEAFRKLAFFEPVENYRYIGFGSTTFTDFIAFHRNLNIGEMISIERRVDYKDRFDFNRPFHCVTVRYGESNDVLREVGWAKRTIVWLDYDGKMKGDVLTDVSTVSAQARSGSLLIISVNAEPYRANSEVDPLEQFAKKLGPYSLPAGLIAKNLEGGELALTCRNLVLSFVSEALRNRNGLNRPEETIKFHPLFNLTYKDGAKMLTVGGIFVEEKERDILRQCQFERLNFIVKGAKGPYEIRVPIMTPRERHYLDRRLPKGATHEGRKIGLMPDEIRHYIELYRYCPSFAEVELS